VASPGAGELLRAGQSVPAVAALARGHVLLDADEVPVVGGAGRPSMPARCASSPSPLTFCSAVLTRTYTTTFITTPTRHLTPRARAAHIQVESSCPT
jgi:hypothetical protein